MNKIIVQHSEVISSYPTCKTLMDHLNRLVLSSVSIRVNDGGIWSFLGSHLRSGIVFVFAWDVWSDPLLRHYGRICWRNGDASKVLKLLTTPGTGINTGTQICRGLGNDGSVCPLWRLSTSFCSIGSTWAWDWWAPLRSGGSKAGGRSEMLGLTWTILDSDRIWQWDSTFIRDWAVSGLDEDLNEERRLAEGGLAIGPACAQWPLRAGRDRSTMHSGLFDDEVRQAAIYLIEQPHIADLEILVRDLGCQRTTVCTYSQV